MTVGARRVEEGAMTETKQITTRKQLGKYVRDMANLMGLRDWLLYLENDPPEDPNHDAVCSTFEGQNTAGIAFSDRWTTWKPDHLRATVVHELLHCHTHRWTEPLDGIQEQIGDLLYVPTMQSTRLNMELTVDNIARAWAETLPLPVLPVRVKAATPGPATDEAEAA